MSFPRRIVRAWGVLASEQRLAALSAVALFATMFLPWYTKDVSAVVDGRLQRLTSSLIAWAAFSFVEAAVLLVVVAVLVLLFLRAEGRAFHLPGGDGTVVSAAGLWVCLLVFYRQFDKPDGEGNAQIGTTFGVTWGIFVTFLAGAAMAYAGFRLRQARLAEPALPGDPDPTDEPVQRRSRREERELRERRAREREERRRAFAELPREGEPGGDPGVDRPYRSPRDDRPRPSGDAVPTRVARRDGPPADEAPTTARRPSPAAPGPRAPADRTSFLGREGAARDLGEVDPAARPAPDPDATSVAPRRRRPPADDDEQLSFEP